VSGGDGPLAALIADGVVGGRLWFYTNYHCNLTCSYCLTGSSPRAPKRLLDPRAMIRLADEAVAAGFTCLGISGGEPFLNRWLPDVAAELARRLPLVLLTNGTLFTPRLLRRVEAFAGLPLEIQISLDSADPVENDAMRGPSNHAKVLAAVPELVARGITVRIATTLADGGAAHDLERLCALHRALGVDDDHHVVRPIVARGRARANGLGIPAGQPELFPELTLTADGAFWSPFAPTSTDGRRLDTELLLTRAIEPLARPARALAEAVAGRPAGDDASLGIR
jgi:MoaA/NifB/PqqE/SkfB family radical SAM enzyme